MTLLLGIVAFAVLAPLAMMLLSSFQLSAPGREPVYGLDGWTRVLNDPSIRSAFGNSISLSVVRQAITLVVGIGLAWLISRTDLPWKNTLEFAFWVAFFLPPLPVAMGWILLLDGKFGLINQWVATLLPFIEGPIFNIYSFWGIVWVHVTTGLGVKVLLLAPAFRNLDAALEESSRSCGASTVGTLFRIVVPLMAPAILVSTVLGLIRSLEAFEIELLLGVPIGLFVYSTKIRDLITFEPPQYAPAAALGVAFLALLLVMVALQRWYLGKRMFRTISGKGFSTRATQLGRWRWPVLSVVLVIAITATLVPIAVLVMGTFMRAFGYFNIPNPWTLQHWQRVLADPQIIRSFTNTMVVSTGAAVIGIVFYGLIAYVIVKTRFAGRALLDLLSWIPWAIPGILMGLALLWTVFRTPFLVPLYGSVYLLIIALVIKTMPLGVQLTKSVLLQLGDELEEASRIAGGSWLQTFRGVVLPILAPTLITVGVVGFMSAARDISTIVLLGSSQSRTLALLALDFAYGGQFERGTVVAVLTVGLVVIAALLARIFGGRIGITGG
ncbi:MAG: ABC-type Fe3+ transport system permease component [Chloroflexi bacterium]|nr:ABC-type Fe3+ transport system permease component [Chloroflexota bacterium]